MKLDDLADVRYFRPNWRAYAALVLVTAVLAAMYRVGLEALARFGEETVPGISRSTLVALQVLLCAAAWLYVAEHLLRRYETDKWGLTVYRMLLPPLRYRWDQVVDMQVYGYGDGCRLTMAEGGHVLIMMECLVDGPQFAGYVQHMAGQFHKAEW